MNNIVVIGSMALDTIKSPCGYKKDILGGSATFFSISSSFFTKVGVVATIGADFPKKHLSTIRSFGVDTKGLETKDGLTFRWEGSYVEDMNCAKTINTQLNVFKDFKPTLPKEYKKSKVAFLANIDPDLQLHILKEIPGDSLIGCDSMNFWIQNKHSSLKTLLKKVHIMFLNDMEAKLFSGEENILKAGRYILSLGPRFVIIKRGEYGAILFVKNEAIFSIPALLLENIVDPTGAGDSFAGGFMGYIAKSGSINIDLAKKALLYGTTMASYAVEDFSIDRFLKIGKKDVADRYKKLKKLISC
ncbi:MAG: PfkB family carbohydrate kinase [Candidatus Omnitrophota bacterium]